MKKTCGLVADGQAVMQSIFAAQPEADRRLSVVGCARDPYGPRQAIEMLAPDMTTRDVGMPPIDGIEFLKRDGCSVLWKAGGRRCRGAAVDRPVPLQRMIAEVPVRCCS